MKTSYYYMAGAALVAYLLYRKKSADQTASGAKGVSKVDEAHPSNGTDWQGSLWDRLSGADLSSPNHPNILPGANADGGGQVAQTTGLLPTWDGSLPQLA